MAASELPSARTTLEAATSGAWWPLAPAVVLIAAGVAGLVSGSAHALDARVLLLMRPAVDPAQLLGPPWLQTAMRDYTALGGTAVLVAFTIAAFGALLVAGRRRESCWLLGGVVGGLAVSTLVKNLVNHPRPDVIPHETYTFTASFPSGHALMSTVVWLLIALAIADASGRPAVRTFAVVVALAFALLVGFSRVYLGVHWTGDVLAGWGIGIAWVWLVRRAQQGRSFNAPKA